MTLSPKTLIRRHNLARIAVTITERTVIARAYPSSFHPEIAKRRERAFAEIAARGDDGVSIAEASRIQSEASEGVLAEGQGDTFETALVALAGLLSRQDKEAAHGQTQA